MKLTAKRFRIAPPDAPEGTVSPDPGAGGPQGPRKGAVPAAGRQAADDAMLFDNTAEDGFGEGPFPTADAKAATPDLERIAAEGLSVRQLRLARRLAQRHNLPATSDLDAVRLLRAQGIDPFQRTTMLALVASGDGTVENKGSRALTKVPKDAPANLPQTVKPLKVPSTEVQAETSHAADILRMQKDLARRRRRRSTMLMLRLFVFVAIPTILTGYYFYVVASPMYATKSEFVIQQAQNPSSAGGLGGLLQGSPMATSQDSIAVQGYLQSRDAMLRLDADHGFKAHYSDPSIDPIQRLPEDASTEATYRLYKRDVLISYDPTEGIVKMTVIAASPQKSAEFASALIGYAEGQVDKLTQRLRGDQMKGAREAYEDADRNMLAAQRRVVELQQQTKVLSSEVEVTLITQQIGLLETQLTQDRLSLNQMQSNARPNAARMDPLVRRIATLEAQVADLRGKLTGNGTDESSLATVSSDLLVAQADVTTRQLLLAQSLQAMETTRMEANRQVRYLSTSVAPVAPDEATYPRAFESTMVALLIFAGIYLMISMTAAILREQVSA